MEQKRRLPQRRNRGLNVIIAQVERAMRKAGYRPSAMVPLLSSISVVGSKDEQIFNVRLNKKTFAIEQIERLSYTYTNDKVIKAISRTSINVTT